MIPRDPCWDLLEKLAVSTRSMIWKNKDPVCDCANVII